MSKDLVISIERDDCKEKRMKYVNIVSKTLHALLYRAYTSCIPKDKNLWLFGAWKGETYNDNSKYIYEYVVKNCPNIKAYWVTKNDVVYEYLTKKQLPVLFYPTKEAKNVICRAKLLFQTEGYKDTGYYPVGGAKVIQLWHGTPAKALNWFKKNNNFARKLFISIVTGRRSSFYWVSQSNFYSEFYHKDFGVPYDHFIKTGSPRCDGINNNEDTLIERIKEKYGFEQVVFYLPTHRNWGNDFDNEFVLNGLDIVDNILSEYKIGFIFKPHPNEMKLFMKSNKHYRNVVILDGSTQEQNDIYQYLFHCDALVSDYSSVIYDFLLTNRPIVLFDYDFDHYQKYDGGVTEEYMTKSVGPIKYSWEDMIKEVISLLENDIWKNKRAELNEFFNEYNSGENCQRLVEVLLNELNAKY